MAKSLNIGVNGMGRIGRKVLRLAFDKKNSATINVCAINEPNSLETLAHLLKYDSVHGIWDADVRIEGNSKLFINGKEIHVYSDRDPSKLPWGRENVDLVMECTGAFTEKEKAGLHFVGGAKRVLISAPSKDADATLCFGVNHENYKPEQHKIVSNASCTTNCLAPVAKVIDDHFGIVRGTMMTVHSYTNDQRILDLAHKDLRRARAAAVSMIPTSTGAAKAVGLVLPHLKGKLDGLSIRVPTPNVSVVDFTVEVNKATNKAEVNAALEAAANGPLNGVLEFCKKPLVSQDFNGNLHSSIVDSELTMALEGTLLKVISWYDNESGFSQRMLDIANFMNSKGV